MDIKFNDSKTFVNFSNHPSAAWSIEQLTAACEYGNIVDLQFPSVDPGLDKDDVMTLARACVDEIEALNPVCVLCQGEFTLCFDIVNLLKKQGVKVVAATSERNVEFDGDTKKIRFTFNRFREY